MRRALSGAVATLLVACGGAPVPPPRPTSTAPASASPSSAPPVVAMPAPGPSEPVVLPHASEVELSSGIRVVVVERSQPWIDVRWVVGSGTASDGERPGRARATAELVAEAAAAKLAGDARGPELFVRAELDHVVVSARALPDALGPTLDAFGAALDAPRTTLVDAKRVAKRMADEESRWLVSLDDVGLRLARHDLFVAPTARHPYGIVHPTAEDLAKLDAASIEACRRAAWVGHDMALVIVGPVGGVDVGALAERAFARAPTSRPEKLAVDDPMARPSSLHILLVDRPGLARASVTVARLGPALEDGDGVATDLWGRVVARRVSDEAHVALPRFRRALTREGPSVALFEADVSSAEVGALVAGLVGADAAKEVSPLELSSAKRAIAGATALDLDRVGFVADALSERVALGLAPSTWEREQVLAETTDAGAVGAAGRELADADVVVVVVGDAKTLIPSLSKSGEVDVLDPSRDLERRRTVPRAPRGAGAETGGKLPSDARPREDG